MRLELALRHHGLIDMTKHHEGINKTARVMEGRRSHLTDEQAEIIVDEIVRTKPSMTWEIFVAHINDTYAMSFGFTMSYDRLYAICKRKREQGLLKYVRGSRPDNGWWERVTTPH